MYTSVLNTQRGYQVASSRNVLGDRHLNLFTICSSNTTIFTPVSQHVTFACKSPVKSHRLYAYKDRSKCCVNKINKTLQAHIGMTRRSLPQC